MIAEWLRQQKGSTNVIVFFGGWGFDQSIVTHLGIDSAADVLFVSDYTDLVDPLPDLTNYKHRSLIAWSFGVGNFSVWQNQNMDVVFDKKVAINGTIPAIDRKYGIPKKIVMHTIDRLSPETYLEFINRCGGSAAAFENIDGAFINSKQNELNQIAQRNYSGETKAIWNKAWISEHDKIFSVENQQRAWQDTPQTLIDASHNPFEIWSDWQDLLA